MIFVFSLFSWRKFWSIQLFICSRHLIHVPPLILSGSYRFDVQNGVLHSLLSSTFPCFPQPWDKLCKMKKKKIEPSKLKRSGTEVPVRLYLTGTSLEKSWKLGRWDEHVLDLNLYHASCEKTGTKFSSGNVYMHWCHCSEAQIRLFIARQLFYYRKSPLTRVIFQLTHRFSVSIERRRVYMSLWAYWNSRVPLSFSKVRGMDRAVESWRVTASFTIFIISVAKVSPKVTLVVLLLNLFPPPKHFEAPTH